MRVLEFRQALDDDQQADLWRDIFSVLFEGTTRRQTRPDDIDSYVAVYHFNSFLLCRSYIESGRCTRSETQARRDDLDHYIIHLVLHGDVFFMLGSARIRLRARDIGILDLSRSARVGFRRAEAISLILPRAELDEPERMQVLRHGRRVLPSAPVGAVLASHLIALSQEAPRLGDVEATVLAGATREMVLTCLSLGPPAEPDPPPVRSDPASRIRSYIEQNLQRPSLGPDDIARNLGLSRSQLYRQFERFGGVGSYIRRRRLNRSFAEICNPRQSHRRISEIAYSLGFEDEAYFSRAFHRTFGLSPRAARTAGGRPGMPADPAGHNPSFAQWVADLPLG